MTEQPQKPTLVLDREAFDAAVEDLLGTTSTTVKAAWLGVSRTSYWKVVTKGREQPSTGFIAAVLLKRRDLKDGDPARFSRFVKAELR